MTKAKAAVFDLGNVLLNWDPDTYYDALIGEERRRAFFAEVPIIAFNTRSDLGENLEHLVENLAHAYPDWGPEIRIWWDHWGRICAPAIDGSVVLLQALKRRGVPVFSLTNFGHETLEVATGQYPFLNLFDANFVSGRLQVMKPDAGIYEALETETGLSGPELVFADDLAENIAAAKARGWQTHHFKGAKGWETALIDAGLLGAA